MNQHTKPNAFVKGGDTLRRDDDATTRPHVVNVTEMVVTTNIASQGRFLMMSVLPGRILILPTVRRLIQWYHLNMLGKFLPSGIVSIQLSPKPILAPNVIASQLKSHSLTNWPAAPVSGSTKNTHKDRDCVLTG